MTYAEKDFQTAFNRWVKIIFRRSGAFELKLSKTASIPFDAVRTHQIDALYHAKHNTLVYKIPDCGVSQKPFDSFSLSGVPAFVVVMYNGKDDHFYMIDIDVFIEEARVSERKSLTEARAAEIGSKYDLKGSTPYTQPLPPSGAYVG